ncbi:hypothetical protein CR513_51838, partial [Mucuna pruriens]
MDLMRAYLKESEEATMIRFLHGLNREIQDRVELQNYGTLKELEHQAVKVEMQLRRRSAFRRSTVGSSSLRERGREEEKVRSEKSPKKGNEPFQGRKEIVVTPSTTVPRTSNIIRAMIVRDDREVTSDSSHRETSTSSEFESHSDDSHFEGYLLMVRRLMGSHMRENIFHSRCLVLGNWCSIIIDRRIYVNVASERLVRKLTLPTLVHLRPYKHQWLSEHKELVVTRGHTPIVGRPWQFDRKVNHDGATNKFTFVPMGQKEILKTLSPREV